MKKAATLGMRSTQLSESLNGDLKDYLKSNLNMDDFFEHFEMVVGQKQDRELEAKYNAREKLPPVCLKNSPLLKQASPVYTPTIFKVFENEYDHASATIIKYQNCSQPVHEYTVVLLEKVGEYKALCSPISRTISCSCRKFETFGILCCHALKVFDILDIKIILDVCILKRWTREPKNGHVIDSIGKDVHGDVNLKVTQRYRRLCPSEIMDRGEPMKNLVEKVKGLKKKEGHKRRKRCKSWVEQQSRRKKKTSTKDTVRQQLSKENNRSSLINYNNSISHVQCYSHKETNQAPNSMAWMTYEGL
ncbi:hypothetical protein CMV_013159 [Castanea mollissima]|uniref:Protein FAR1-RELATED SEQUENCE n=1 Tax=Castanea mollissima TaxID=60419 RepID=A0A8J4VM89_9ROSI|nr:hypothetical protein CMV_013159 [Castanea mollissima]